MRFVNHPDIARFRITPGTSPGFGRGPNPPLQFLGARPGLYCDPPCPGQICCANGACVTSVAECGLLAAQPPVRAPRQRSRVRRKNPSISLGTPGPNETRTIADEVLGVFGVAPRHMRKIATWSW